MEWLYDLVGRYGDTITWWQMSVRTVIVFFYLLLLARLGGTRAFGSWTPFDIVLGILLGSTLSRALTANAPFVPTLIAGALLILLHRLLAALAVRWHAFGFLVKGRAVKLIEGGRMLDDNLRRTGISERDLREQLRSSLNTDDLDTLDEAYLERGGDVSFGRR
jgi:uncharacterized membrane protein YcaP (DUF421 family)